MVNLKQVLMDLGNELVMDHGFEPATGNPSPGVPNTVPIKTFTNFLNEWPEARVVLRKMGFDWPVVPKSIGGTNG